MNTQRTKLLTSKPNVSEKGLALFTSFYIRTMERECLRNLPVQMTPCSLGQLPCWSNGMTGPCRGPDAGSIPAQGVLYSIIFQEVK